MLQAGANWLTELQQLLLFVGFEKDSLLRNPFPQHPHLGSHKFKQLDKFLLATGGQVEVQRLEQSNHGDILDPQSTADVWAYLVAYLAGRRSRDVLEEKLPAS